MQNEQKHEEQKCIQVMYTIYKIDHILLFNELNLQTGSKLTER